MEQYIVMTKRNLKMFLRERGAVFFSLLTMLIVIALMVLFLGDMNIEAIKNILSAFPNRDAAVDAENAKLTVLVWTFAGIVSINAVTVTLSAYSIMMKDKASAKINAIYTAPVSRFTIAASYITSAWLASCIVCILTLVITEIYQTTQGLTFFSPKTHAILLGLIAVNSFVYASFMYVLTNIVKTEGAWSGFGTVVGTLVGFLGGIYLPVGSLSEGIGNAMKCTPIIYGASAFRQVMMEDILAQTFDGMASKVIPEYKEAMGISITVYDHVLTMPEELLILFVCGMIFLVIGVLLLTLSKKSDR